MKHAKMGLLKRIERLEGQLSPVRQSAGCICYPFGGSFHTMEEMQQAREIPCPAHGKRHFREGASIVHLSIDTPLAPADRHLCHCPPMLLRTAVEQGQVLTEDELRRAETQYIEYWEQECRKVA